MVLSLKESTRDLTLQDMVEYQRSVAREIEARLEAKCDALADLFAMDERGQLLMKYSISWTFRYQFL